MAESIISREMLKKKVDEIPRVKLAVLPTLLQDCPRFSKALGGPRILIKREDLTGLAFGGNKTRKVDFFMANLVDRGAEMVGAGASI